MEHLGHVELDGSDAADDGFVSTVPSARVREQDSAYRARHVARAAWQLQYARYQCPVA